MSALSTRIENDPYSGLGEQIGSRALRPHRAVGFGSARLDGGPELRLVVREDPVSLSCRFKSCSSWAWSSSRASTDCRRFSLASSSLKCKGGAALSNEQILNMNFYVKGIDDKLPQ